MSKNSIFSIIAARVPVTLLYPSSFIRDLPRILIRPLVIFYNFYKHPASEIGPKTNDKYYSMANVKCKSQALAFPLCFYAFILFNVFFFNKNNFFYYKSDFYFHDFYFNDFTLWFSYWICAVDWSRKISDREYISTKTVHACIFSSVTSPPPSPEKMCCQPLAALEDLDPVANRKPYT